MVIVFEDPLVRGRLVAHRVVKRLPGDAPRWVTKGDANAENDPVPISASAIQGRARWAVPGAGRVASAATGWIAVVVLVGLAARPPPRHRAAGALATTCHPPGGSGGAVPSLRSRAIILAALIIARWLPLPCRVPTNSVSRRARLVRVAYVSHAQSFRAR